MADDGDPTPELDLLEIYKVHVEEYRYQVRLNWERSRYFLGLIALLLSAGVGLLRIAGEGARPLTALVFLSGCAISWLSVQILATQTDYYRSAREGMALAAQRLELGELALRTTPTMGGALTRRWRVNQAIGVVLATLGIVNLVGLVYVLLSWLAS
jgi:hypothetical protein